MELTIINNTESQIDDWSDSKLLWLGVLTADKVHLASPLSVFMMMAENFHRLSEEQKFDSIKKKFPTWNPAFKLEQLERIWKHYIGLKNKKGKNKKDLILFHKARKLIGSMERNYHNWLLSSVKNTKANELMKFHSWDDDSVIFFWMLHNYNPNLTGHDSLIESIATTVYEKEELPCFDKAVKEVAFNCRLTDINPDEFFGKQGLKFFYEDFFEMPQPESLNYELVKSIREEVSTALREAWNRMEEFCGELAKVEFCRENFDTIKTGFEDNVLSTGRKICEALSNNHLMDALRQKSDIKTYRMHAGMCSMDDIINLYCRLGVIDEQTAMYSKQWAMKYVNLKGAGVFLFMTEQ